MQYKMLLATMPAVAALFLNGCCCFCEKNPKVGIPRITCQPADQKVSPGSTASFQVEVKEKACRFAWYRATPVTGGFKTELMDSKPGGLTDTLKIQNVQKADEGYYFCAITHEAGGENGDVDSQTRLAELKVRVPPKPLAARAGAQLETKTYAFAWTNMAISPQTSSRVLQGGVPGNGSCIPQHYVASLTYTSDDDANDFLSPNIASTCRLNVTQWAPGAQAGIPLPNTQFAARWNTAGATPPANTGCLIDSGTNDKQFTVVRKDKKHTFVIYFVAQPAAGTTNVLSVTWN